MIERPDGARMFSLDRRARLSDCAPSGRVRLDALARWLQDVAYGDVEDVGLHRLARWVIRRLRMNVLRFPRIGQRCHLETFCSAVGSMWAQRRTTLTLCEARATEPLMESVALWVHLDPDQYLPTRLTDAERTIYGASIDGRQVDSRRRHRQPTVAQLKAATRKSWTFRHSDADLAQHINNAAYWTVLEDILIGQEQQQATLAALDTEIEFRMPTYPGVVNVWSGTNWHWVTDQNRNVHASILLLDTHTRPEPNR